MLFWVRGIRGSTLIVSASVCVRKTNGGSFASPVNVSTVPATLVCTALASVRANWDGPATNATDATTDTSPNPMATNRRAICARPALWGTNVNFVMLDIRVMSVTRAILGGTLGSTHHRSFPRPFPTTTATFVTNAFRIIGDITANLVRSGTTYRTKLWPKTTHWS